MEEKGKKSILDYANGKIYKLVSGHSNKIYIGSTCNQLSKRLYQHKTKYDSFCKGKCKYVTSFDLVKLGYVDIILLEKYPCTEKIELHARERYWIEKFKSIVVNKNIPTRTDEEYAQDNKERILNKNRFYLENNKEKRSQTCQQYRESHRIQINQKCICICGMEYNKSNKRRHEGTKIHKKYVEDRMSKQMQEIIELHNKSKCILR